MPQSKIPVGRLTPSIHGGIDYTEIAAAGMMPGDILDFSTNCNPMGPPPGLKFAIKDVNIEAYPDSESGELRQALSDKFQIDSNKIIIGSGSTELIRLATTAYFNRKDNVLIYNPTYSEYEIACQLIGCTINKLVLSPADNFKFDVNTTISQIKTRKANGIFLCNPNNPTGQYLTRDDVEQIIRADENCLVILDEAYIAFTNNAWSSLYLLKHENLVIIRSMTKDFALAGLRIGYALADKKIISVLNRIKPPWNISSVAQKAALFALDCDEYVRKCCNEIQRGKSFLTGEFEKMGLSPVPSQTNFFLIKVGNAAKIKKQLLEKGLLVRDCTSLGLPDYIRIAPRRLSQCRKLIKAITEIGVTIHDG
jgi:histidinol-phosphate aminotransferase